MYKKKNNKKIYQVQKKIMAAIVTIWIVCCLSACTSKDEIVLELEKQDAVSKEQDVVFEEAEKNPEEQKESTEEQEEVSQDISEMLTESRIYVHICGAVVNPGVYEVSGDSRVYEGIKSAGGFTEDAYEDYVNQAERMQDGQKIVIPTVEEAEAKGLDNQSSLAEAQPLQEDGAEKRVNINTATESELCAINGIGAGRAAAIVKYRQTNGNFTATEDIMKVSGIKEGTYEKIKDWITVK